MDIISKIVKRVSDTQKISIDVIKNPDVIEDLINGISSDKAVIKYGCEKVLRLVSEQRPDLIYPYFDFFVEMLDYNNNFLRWGAIITISNLTIADTDKKFDKIFNKYFRFISGPTMISAANVIANAYKIANAKSYLADRIASEIIKVKDAKFELKGELSSECINVAIGHAINCFGNFFNKIKNKKPVINFVRNELKNTRDPVRKRAQEFLKKRDA